MTNAERESEDRLDAGVRRLREVIHHLQRSPEKVKFYGAIRLKVKLSMNLVDGCEIEFDGGERLKPGGAPS